MFLFCYVSQPVPDLPWAGLWTKEQQGGGGEIACLEWTLSDRGDRTTTDFYTIPIAVTLFL